MGDIIAYFDLSGARRRGVVVDNNTYTCWVRLVIGSSNYITIKRHKVKHNVKFV